MPEVITTIRIDKSSFEQDAAMLRQEYESLAADASSKQIVLTASLNSTQFLVQLAELRASVENGPPIVIPTVMGAPTPAPGSGFGGGSVGGDGAPLGASAADIVSAMILRQSAPVSRRMNRPTVTGQAFDEPGFDEIFEGSEVGGGLLALYGGNQNRPSGGPSAGDDFDGMNAGASGADYGEASGSYAAFSGRGGGGGGYGAEMIGRYLKIKAAIDLGMATAEGLGVVGDDAYHAYTGQDYSTAGLQSREKSLKGAANWVGDVPFIGKPIEALGSSLERGASAALNNSVTAGTAGNDGQLRRGFESDIGYGERVEGEAKSEDKKTEAITRRAEARKRENEVIEQQITRERELTAVEQDDSPQRAEHRAELRRRDLQGELKDPRYTDSAGHLTEVGADYRDAQTQKIAADEQKDQRDDQRKSETFSFGVGQTVSAYNAQEREANMRTGGDDRGAALDASSSAIDKRVDSLQNEAKVAKETAQTTDEYMKAVLLQAEADAAASAGAAEKAANIAASGRAATEAADRYEDAAAREKLALTPGDFQGSEQLKDKEFHSQMSRMSPGPDRDAFANAHDEDRRTDQERHQQQLGGEQEQATELNLRSQGNDAQADLAHIEYENTQSMKNAGGDLQGQQAAQNLSQARLAEFQHRETKKPDQQTHIYHSGDDYADSILSASIGTKGGKDADTAAALAKAKKDQAAIQSPFAGILSNITSDLTGGRLANVFGGNPTVNPLGGHSAPLQAAAGHTKDSTEKHERSTDKFGASVDKFHDAVEKKAEGKSKSTGKIYVLDNTIN